jgi:hypothetical protein
MQIKLINITSAVISSCLLIACLPQPSQTLNAKSVATQGVIRVGMRQSEVEQIFGAPRSVYRYQGGATATGTEELHHYVGGTSVGYIKGLVATFSIR